MWGIVVIPGMKLVEEEAAASCLTWKRQAGGSDT